MTGHVAQVFLDDDEWRTVLRALRRALRTPGWLAFESRNPLAEPWRSWTREQTRSCHPAADGREAFESWVQTVEVGDRTVTFTGHTVFVDSGEEVVVESTLRFRSREELERDLAATGFEVEALHGDWQGGPFESSSRELIFVAATRDERPAVS